MVNFSPSRASVRAFFETVVCFFGTGCAAHVFAAWSTMLPDRHDRARGDTARAGTDNGTKDYPADWS
ncbi:secreted hydrolase [Streptomyces laurentii]|uniref:Secreted hydrolase n=1 Tax=Streptomyces laurentii TaxID=39478 RepID=A0A170RU84_STRLU|nr:secreted hydrolase [Streptomyces laurentii]